MKIVKLLMSFSLLFSALAVGIEASVIDKSNPMFANFACIGLNEQEISILEKVPSIDQIMEQINKLRGEIDLNNKKQPIGNSDLEGIEKGKNIAKEFFKEVLGESELGKSSMDAIFKTIDFGTYAIKEGNFESYFQPIMDNQIPQFFEQLIALTKDDDNLKSYNEYFIEIKNEFHEWNQEALGSLLLCKAQFFGEANEEIIDSQFNYIFCNCLIGLEQEFTKDNKDILNNLKNIITNAKEYLKNLFIKYSTYDEKNWRISIVGSSAVEIPFLCVHETGHYIDYHYMKENFFHRHLSEKENVSIYFETLLAYKHSEHANVIKLQRLTNLVAECLCVRENQFLKNLLDKKTESITLDNGHIGFLNEVNKLKKDLGCEKTYFDTYTEYAKKNQNCPLTAELSEKGDVLVWFSEDSSYSIYEGSIFDNPYILGMARSLKLIESNTSIDGAMQELTRIQEQQPLTLDDFQRVINYLMK